MLMELYIYVVAMIKDMSYDKDMGYDEGYGLWLRIWAMIEDLGYD